MINERLKELKQQAGIDFNPDQEGLDLFAELILSKCLTICEDMGDNSKDGHYCADEIARTFLR
jgi:hypothetical protein